MSGTADDIVICPGCGGRRVQRNAEGILVRCPVCGGSGMIYTELGVHVTY